MRRSTLVVSGFVSLALLASAVDRAAAGPQAAVAEQLEEQVAAEQPAPSEQAAAESLAGASQEYHGRGAGRPNVLADFSPRISSPQIAATAYLDPQSSVIGDVEIGRRVYVAPFASVRGDEGQPIRIGPQSNVQDGAVVHALETYADGQPRLDNTYLVNGRRYAVYVGDRVSIAHQAQVHGPAWIENDVFVGMQAFVFKARVGSGCVLEPGAKVFGREQPITIPPGRYVVAGAVVTTQAQANALPRITPSYPFRNLNAAVVHVNTSLADGYNGVPADSH